MEFGAHFVFSSLGQQQILYLVCIRLIGGLVASAKPVAPRKDCWW